MGMDDKLDRLEQLRQRSLLGGGQARIDAQHEKGKLTARERIDLLLDPGSFEELDSLAVDEDHHDGEGIHGGAVVTGGDDVDGGRIDIFAVD